MNLGEIRNREGHDLGRASKRSVVPARFSARGRLFAAVMLLTLRGDLVHITATVASLTLLRSGSPTIDAAYAAAILDVPR